MRMACAVSVGVLIIEALLAGAFALGFYVFGGVPWGLLCSGIMLLLLVLPWPGELRMVFDSEGPRGVVRIGWWGKVSFVTGDTTTRAVIRILGIPIRRTLRKKAARGEQEREETEEPKKTEKAEIEEIPPVEDTGGDVEERREEPKELAPTWRGIDSETVEAFCRLIGSGLGASCELIWAAEEIRVIVESPAERAAVDSVIQEVFGRRQVGPVDVTLFAGEESRRVRALYRIGLLRAALAGVQVMVDGRIREFIRQQKAREQASGASDEDRRLIEKMEEEQSSREEDKD